ncbi:MAG: flagellar hook assembly protein FlgD [Treponema sp.]|jgi:flagellar basal-body rod modification protein FlgD|nr:flagellar hook assembly protein FlgD [Treponema sp.]
MALQSVLNAGEKASLERLVHDHNSKLNQGKIPQQNLGKDDFLKILITQLSYQDPTAPMEDKEFIAQMAQFSTLEQMTGMAGDFARLTEMLTNTEATSALGRSVELNVALPGNEEERVVQGVVRAVTRGASPQVLVNGTYYDWTQVSRVFEE